MDQNKHPGLKIWLIETFSRVYPKIASTRRVNRKIADSTRNEQVFFSRYLAANYGSEIVTDKRTAVTLVDLVIQ